MSCPKCKWDPYADGHDDDEPGEEGSLLVERKDWRSTSTDYGPGKDWIDVWECKNGCGLFECDNGYP